MTRNFREEKSCKLRINKILRLRTPEARFIFTFFPFRFSLFFHVSDPVKERLSRELCVWLLRA